MADQDFLIYSLPNSIEWTRLSLHQSVNNRGLVVQGFDGHPQCFEIVESTASIKVGGLDLKAVTPIHNRSKPEYEALIEKAIQFCKEHNGKVVCSRSADIELSVTEEAITCWLERLRIEFPNAFIYLLNTEKHGVWLGATPETLVSKQGNAFQTVAFAGTRWNDEPFEEKEFQEQQIVTDTILQDLGLDADAAGERKEVAYGAIRHLQTEIKWTSAESLLEVAKKLHPTPAVCGWPRGLARSFILENELRNRNLYTGFIALQTTDTNVAFVNLRCMQLFRDRIRFYVGGGVNSMSIPTMEWEETERKMRTLLDAMKINA